MNRWFVIILLASLIRSAFAFDIEGEGESYIVDAPVPPVEVDIWSDKGERSVYYPGEDIRIYFKLSRDAYVVVYDVDTEGRVKLLYPQDPYEAPMTEGRVTHRLPPVGSPWSYNVSGPTGIEYVAVVASTRPFDWDEYIYELGGGGTFEAVSTDPQLGIERINQLIAPRYEGMPYYVSDWTMFYVERRVPYPRFMCYDCHWPWYQYWDPYYDICPAFDIVIFGPYESYYYNPPFNRYGRKPHFWYKKKTNKDYPNVRYKYKRTGDDYWETKGKRTKPDNNGDGYKEKTTFPEERYRWKETEDVREPDEDRWRSPEPVYPSREREAPDKDGEYPDKRDKDPEDNSGGDSETRPLYREEKQRVTETPKSEPRGGERSGGEDSSGDRTRPSSTDRQRESNPTPSGSSPVERDKPTSQREQSQRQTSSSSREKS